MIDLTDKVGVNLSSGGAMGQRQPKKNSRGAEALLQRRVSKAKEMVESEMSIVTLRIPQALNEWLNRYVSLSYPERNTKQALVIEALTLCYLMRGEPKERKFDIPGFPAQGEVQ